jgi:hypothetical protein
MIKSFTYFFFLMLIVLSCRQEKKSQGEEKSKWSKGHSVNFNQELLIREQMQIKLFLDHQKSLKMNLTNSGLRYMIYKNGVGKELAKLRSGIADVDSYIEKLEDRFLDKSNASIEFHQKAFDVRSFLAEKEREDFRKTISDLGFTEEEVSIVSKDETDQIEFPQDSGSKISLRKSPIHGTGVFANFGISEFEVIGPARLSGKRTPIGRYVNHSLNPNSFFVNNDEGDIYLMALRQISGCCGGDFGEEITADYSQAVRVNKMTLEGATK